MIVCILLFTLVVAACGDNQSAERTRMEHRFEQIDFEMGNMENLNSAFGPELTNMTNRYIKLVRHYANLLGPLEVRKRLLQKRDEVAPYCLACSATFQFEASRYPSSR